MKKLLPLFLLALFCGCVSMTGTYSYIPVGPQNLSQTITDSKTMPVYVAREDITRPWAGLGLMRIKNLPNDRTVIAGEIEKLKLEAAKKGADALIINQYFEENAPTMKYPVTIAAYLVKYLDELSEADQLKVQQFAQQAAMENAK